ncbi:cyclase family protein [Leptolyngbya sp. 7M]|uniref:cyclase family protein n=1 Tax=Leptolyngbya sp. 7M TaxID=2812896 RepID=UPI001B8AECDB|nr:cyclase family protein [Leptolyngbya sp. 7M]QYO63445.1 cyclase family protein [Leptolyngbya sp. 7M]
MNGMSWRVVDLTHPLTTAMPLWAGDPAIEIQPWASYDQEGYLINRLTIGEHSGTHWGTPNSFIPNARSADQFTAQELVVPAVVLDRRESTESNPDYCFSLADLEAWEARYGLVPSGSLVILFTGWQDRWNHSPSFFNRDAQGTCHFPGFGAEAVAFLIAERHIVGLGTDTHGVDPGSDPTYAASTAIYEADGLILECLAGLDQLPPTGAILVIGGLPVQGGSGSPARVLALLPAV